MFVDRRSNGQLVSATPPPFFFLVLVQVPTIKVNSSAVCLQLSSAHVEEELLISYSCILQYDDDNYYGC